MALQYDTLGNITSTEHFSFLVALFRLKNMLVHWSLCAMSFLTRSAVGDVQTASGISSHHGAARLPFLELYCFECLDVYSLYLFPASQSLHREDFAH
jgi:hypothetical protein